MLLRENHHDAPRSRRWVAQLSVIVVRHVSSTASSYVYTTTTEMGARSEDDFRRFVLLPILRRRWASFEYVYITRCRSRTKGVWCWHIFLAGNNLSLPVYEVWIKELFPAEAGSRDSSWIRAPNRDRTQNLRCTQVVERTSPSRGNGR